MKYKFLSALLITLAACSSNSNSSTDAANITDAASVTIMVTYQGTQHPVDLAPLTEATMDASPVIMLSTIIQAGLPTAVLANLQATDFIGSDGFKPSTKANCQSILPVDGSILARGWIDLDQNVWWPEDLSYPGCMDVHGLTEILIADK